MLWVGRGQSACQGQGERPGYGQTHSPDPVVTSCTHRLCDPLAEDGQQEQGSDRRGQVAGDRLDVVEKLATVGALDDGDPEDADDDQEHHKHSAGRVQGAMRRAGWQGTGWGTGHGVGGEGAGDAWEPGRGSGCMVAESENVRTGIPSAKIQNFKLFKSQNTELQNLRDQGFWNQMPLRSTAHLLSRRESIPLTPPPTQAGSHWSLLGMPFFLSHPNSVQGSPLHHHGFRLQAPGTLPSLGFSALSLSPLHCHLAQRRDCTLIS